MCLPVPCSVQGVVPKCMEAWILRPVYRSKTYSAVVCEVKVETVETIRCRASSAVFAVTASHTGIAASELLIQWNDRTAVEGTPS